ncbi:MAG: M23 family metallopeptidase [Pseudomonadota bacterium]
MQTRLIHRLHRALEQRLPEKRLFLRSDTETRFIRLKPETQLIGLAGSSLLVAWTIIATAILLMDSIGAGNFRDQAKRDQLVYQERLNALSSERHMRAEEALAAQERFNSALEQISVMQSELLASEDRRREVETGLEVVQNTLRDVMQERDSYREEAKDLLAAMENGEGGTSSVNSSEMEATVALLSSVLEDTASERDNTIDNAADALEQAEALTDRLAEMEKRNDEIFRQLEDAMTVSVKPLDKMFRAAGMNTESMLNQVRRGYSGQGGPLTPLNFSSMGFEPDADSARANRIIEQMDQLNLYRIAAQKAPFATPVKSAFRFTSGFGYRRDPKTGGRRMHNGVDFAASSGTPLYSTADGVVVHAGWSSGYGRLVKIQHEFGIETRYAHLSRLRVKVGQRVSRGDRIGDMGASGRVTGVHLHYEVRVGGKPVNPMTFIKAANDVF